LLVVVVLADIDVVFEVVPTIDVVFEVVATIDVVLLASLDKTIVIGTTIVVMIRIAAIRPAIIHIFFLCALPLLKSESFLY
jgi:hypothetical protein